MPTAPAEKTPRDCTIADALEVIGDRWSLLIPPRWPKYR